MSAPHALTHQLPHDIYGLFDRHSRLLYVGCTYNLDQRVSQHTMERPWWHEVTRVEVLTSVPNRPDALAEERRLIRELRPAYNLNWNLRRVEWTVDDYLGTLSAWLKQRVADGFADEGLRRKQPWISHGQKLIQELAQRYDVRIDAGVNGEALSAVECMREDRRLAAQVAT